MIFNFDAFFFGNRSRGMFFFSTFARLKNQIKDVE